MFIDASCMVILCNTLTVLRKERPFGLYSSQLDSNLDNLHGICENRRFGGFPAEPEKKSQTLMWTVNMRQLKTTRWFYKIVQTEKWARCLEYIADTFMTVNNKMAEIFKRRASTSDMGLRKRKHHSVVLVFF